ILDDKDMTAKSTNAILELTRDETLLMPKTSDDEDGIVSVLDDGNKIVKHNDPEESVNEISEPKLSRFAVMMTPYMLSGIALDLGI
ncbi:8951_t:CDS:1, partial [Acaulospora morrowiae]